MMKKILFGVEGVQISIHDEIIHVATIAEHAKRLRHVFEWCHQYNLKLNKDKCEFSIQQILISGHADENQSHQNNASAGECVQPSTNSRDVWLRC